MLTALLRALLARSPDLLVPELRLVEEDEPDLARYRLLGSGYFATNVTYAMHPHESGAYIRIADFHRYLLAEKRAEFTRIAAALGAKSIRVAERELRKRGSDLRIEASVPVEGVPVAPRASFARQSNEQADCTLAASFERPLGPPRLPDGLRWLGSEPEWTSMVLPRGLSDGVMSRLRDGHREVAARVSRR